MWRLGVRRSFGAQGRSLGLAETTKGQGLVRIAAVTLQPRRLASSSNDFTQPKELDSDHFAQPEPFDFSADPSALDPETVATAVNAVLAVPSYSEKPSYLVMQAIDSLHIALGIPYWEAIVLLTLGVRLALIPLSVMQLKSAATLAVIKPEIDKIQSSMSQDTDKSLERKHHYETQVKALFKEHDFKPLRMWMPFLQLPVFVGFFVGIREMGQYFPGFVTGGALWFNDLTTSDPTYILPVVNGVSMLLMFETGLAMNPQADKTQAETMRWVMRAASFAMIPLMISMPNGLFVHWGVNNAMSIAQSVILGRADVKAYLGIKTPPAPPVSPQSNQNPFVKLVEENQRILREGKRK